MKQKIYVRRSIFFVYVYVSVFLSLFFFRVCDCDDCFGCRSLLLLLSSMVDIIALELVRSLAIVKIITMDNFSLLLYIGRG